MLTGKHNTRIVIRESDRVGSWVCERTGGVWSPVDAYAIGLERDGALVAGVVYDHYNGASVCMHVASDGSRRWLNRQYLHFCFDYAFNRLSVKKVVGVVPSDNPAALNFDLHLGFTEEARLKGAHPNGDLIFLTMTRPQCRWLKE
jgi:RimJ/RimL family protein N-acetyltransferase